MRILAIILLAVLSWAPSGARAHPHEFVEARLELVFDGTGLLTGIGVEWRYDAFTTMLILADFGLNPAADTLSPGDAAKLHGFDLNWQDGYDGDLWPTLDGAPITLGPPQGGAVSLEDGQLVSRHFRPLPVPADPAAGELAIRVYDPEYYVAYTLAPPAAAGETGCRMRVFVPDLAFARARLEAALDELFAGGIEDIEGAFPAVGADFAEEIVIDCAPDRN